jgi:hypothetical protein
MRRGLNVITSRSESLSRFISAYARLANRELIIDKNLFADVKHTGNRDDKTINAGQGPLANAVSACYV